MESSAQAERVSIRLILSDRAVVTVIALAFVLMVGTGLVLPILPLYARSFGIGYGEAGILISAYALARLVSDLLSALAVVFWAGAGAGSSFVFAAMYSHLLKLVPQTRMARTLSVFYGAFNVGVVFGGFAAGVIAHYLGLAAPLFFTAGVSIVCAALYLRFLPARGQPVEPPLTAQEVMLERQIAVPRHARARIAHILRTPGFVMVIATNLAYMWMIVAIFDTLVPLFAHDALGMSTVGIGAVFAIALATEFVVLYPAGSAADRRGRKFVLVPSLVALAIMTAAVGWAETPIMLGVAMALLGVASGFAGVPPGA